MTKILVIDADARLVQSIRMALESADFQVETAWDGASGLRVAFDTRPDLILLDLMLPGMDGFETCRRLRELSDVPIILLSARTAEENVVKGLGTGADDYVTKPFGMPELIARIQNGLRRRTVPSIEKRSVLIIGDLAIDHIRHKVKVRNQLKNLSPTEYHLLMYLASNRGRVIPHRVLLTEVWGNECANQVEYLHLYIRYLRKKIERDPSKPRIIKTEWNVGYYIED